MADAALHCLLVTKDAEGKVQRQVTDRPLSELPAGDVLIRVQWSSLNYKDGLSASGHPGVTRKFPHVPGIDAAGTVVESSVAGFDAGQEVLVTGFDQGQNTWGGLGDHVRVPAGWVVPLPKGLSLRDSMIYGTAGFTAALAIEALQECGVQPNSGEVVVTGATGGVGSTAVAMLAHLGYRVAAVSGKPEATDWLKQLGAAEVLPREAVNDSSPKPLLAGRWAGAVDTVGGVTLATLLKQVARYGVVTVTGLVGGADLPTSVYPFILRAAKLVGIDSAEYPIARRGHIWSQMAGPWRPPGLASISAGEVTLDQLEPKIADILAGKVRGRVLVRHR